MCARRASPITASRYSRTRPLPNGSGYSSGRRSSTSSIAYNSTRPACSSVIPSLASSAASITIPGSFSSLCGWYSEQVSRLLLAGFCVAILVFATQILELARPAGIDFTHRNSPTSQKYLIETMGGGVALLDYNNDGLLDIFLVSGGKLDDPVKLPANFSRRDPAFWNRLYRQNRDGSFTDATAAAGLAGGGNDYGMGVAVGDYNNDG